MLFPSGKWHILTQFRDKTEIPFELKSPQAESPMHFRRDSSEEFMAKNAKKAKKPMAAADHLQPTHISVTFKIVTPDQLRKIIFTLTKMSDAKNDSWSVMFELDERAEATKDFNLVIQLQVDVDHNDPDADAQAAATAKHGMDADQREQTLVAGDTAKDAKTGNGGVTVDDAKQDAVAVVTSRNPNSPA